MTNTYLATAAFGLEGIVKRELCDLGFDAKAELGCVRFTATQEQAFRANLWLRTADRVLLLVGEGEARSFEELFELVRALPWSELLPRDARFPVSGKCARSQLMSVRDCQAITKKAIAEHMKAAYRTTWCAETGAEYAVDVSLHGDIARLTVDTSGEALNRRGYRTWNGEAPLRETLAAAMSLLSPWRMNTPLHDPCCGTGTLLIESAMRMSNRAPGLTRSFAIEQWPTVDKKEIDRARNEAKAAYHPENIRDISGTDIDPAALELCRRHIVQAGMDGKIKVWQSDLRTLQLDAPAPCFLLNPPYGERMSDKKSCEALYRSLREMKQRHPGSHLCVITSHPGFERCYGARALKKRRLYNGRLECEYLIY
jgi:putative N6-adenine-specific DNA methylase